MTRIPVWAPLASRVELEVGRQRIPMTPDTARIGWWTTTDDVPPGTEYLVVLDGDAVPDPLARHAPYGVHGPSRAVDPATFYWLDSAWTGIPFDQRCLVYELHVGTFTPEGTLDAAADRLGHLADLGVSHVELLPLAAFEGDRGWGYDGVLLNAIHPAYGDPESLVRFVDLAHRVGLAVLLDVVHNHLGPSGNHWDRFGPFFTDRHHTPWGRAVNLDAPGSDDVRAILRDSALGWLRDYHLDGLRLDAVHELHDSRALSFLEELSMAVDALSTEVGRPLVLVAESDRNDPRTVTPREHGGLGLTAQWDDDVHHALHWILTGESRGYYADFASCESAAHALERAFLHDGRWSSFRGRTHGRPVDRRTVGPERFVVALQTHDQVGNRAAGDRLSMLVSRDRAAAGAALLLALPYVPMIFMGEEWGATTPWCFFAGFTDPDLARAVTEGRRREFAEHGWTESDVPDPLAVSTYRSSVLDWSQLDSPAGRSLLAWYRELALLRLTVLGHGEEARVAWEADVDGRPRWWAVITGEVLTVVDLAHAEPVTLVAATSGQPSVLASWAEGGRVLCRPDVTDSAVVVLPPGGCLVVSGVTSVHAADAVLDLRAAVEVREVRIAGRGC